MAAFVLGNGVSRRPIDIEFLKLVGDVYACNAVYRTHAVTALIATDRPIANEIQASGYSQRHRFYTRRPLPDLGAVKIPQEYFGFSSGPVAAAIACLDHHDTLYLLGFDLGGNEQGRFNNVFADSEHYKTTGSLPTYAGNWVKQLIKIAKNFPHVRIIRVKGSTTATVPEFTSLPNFNHMDMSEFIARINNPKDL